MNPDKHPILWVIQLLIALSLYGLMIYVAASYIFGDGP